MYSIIYVFHYIYIFHKHTSIVLYMCVLIYVNIIEIWFLLSRGNLSMNHTIHIYDKHQKALEK